MLDCSERPIRFPHSLTIASIPISSMVKSPALLKHFDLSVSDPAVPCPLIICPECPKGFQTEKPLKAGDDCNKFSCKCVPEEKSVMPKKPCPQIHCPMGKFGACKMVDGCRFCKCLPLCPPVPEVCPPGCEKKHKFHCPFCHCPIRPPICRPMICLMFCEYGHEVDVHGCKVCRCKQKCQNQMCKMKCKNGFQEDDQGCPICKCKPDKCPPVMCAMFCKNGFKTDKNGCNLCKCNPECPKVMCRKYCKFGFMKDANGCEVCKCIRVSIEWKPKKVGAPGSLKG